jgi:hypothetical protein
LHYRLQLQALPDAMRGCKFSGMLEFDAKKFSLPGESVFLFHNNELGAWKNGSFSMIPSQLFELGVPYASATGRV